MIPTGGISLVLHLCINLLAWVGRHIPFSRNFNVLRGLPAPVTGLVLSAVIVFFAASLLVNALTSENNLDHAAFLLDTCEPIPGIISTSTVIIRIDDIQAYAWADISERMFTDAETRRIPLSLAVIPVGLRDDISFYNTLRSHRCMLEFGLHGWDNQEPAPGVGEFANLTKEEAANKIQKGLAVINRLSRESVHTFVPPLNQMSTGTIQALKEHDIKVISSLGTNRFDYDATTFNFTTDTLNTLETVLNECELAFSAGSTECVVMVHPQDFTTNSVFDPSKYALFTNLLDTFIARGYTFARFKDFAEQ